MITSAASSCARTEVDGVVIEDLSVYADGVAGVAMGDMQLEVNGLALRLYGAVLARPYHGNDGLSFVIDQGAAHFIVTGSIGASEPLD